MQNSQFQLIFAMALLVVACKSDEGQTPVAPNPSSESPAAHAETKPATQPPAIGQLMKDAQGNWQGTKTLWIKYPDDPKVSDTKVSVSSNRIEYSWSYEGKPQTGVFKFSGSGDAVGAVWTDTWHSKEELVCTGSDKDGVIKVTGTYSAGGIWSWRTEVHVEGKDKLSIKMFNKLPDEMMPELEVRELPAVVMELTRVP